MAFVLALSMLFSQNAIVFATEGANPVSENETVETPVQTPAQEETAVSEQEAPAEEPQEEAEPAPEETPAAAGETPDTEQAEVSENGSEPAETVSEDEAEAEPEEAAGAVSDNTVSLSGGTITVSINKSAHSESENLTYAKDVTVSESKIVKYVGEAIGFDFDVVSANGPDGKDVILKEGTDYEVKWTFEQDGDVSRNKAKTDIAQDEGTITVSINGLSDNKTGGGFKNWLNIKAKVIPAVKPSISQADLKIDYISYNRVTISNNSKTKGMYVAVVSRNNVGTDLYVQGDYIAPGAKKTVYSYYYDTNKRTSITEKQPLTVVAHIDSEFSVKDAQAKEDFETKEKTGDASGAPEDGLEKIKMKAVVNKSTQTIKISWNPAKSLGYKYYELQRLGTNEETFTTLENWKDKNNNTKLTKTSYTYGKKAIEKAAQPAVFQLICYGSDKTEKARYITVAAPSLLYVEQGYDTNNMEYCFSKLYEDNDMAYRLELAEKNVENGSTEVGKRGFKQTENKANVYYSTDITEIKDFAVKKGVSVNALREYFMGDSELTLKPGVTYYARVKSVYSWHGATYTSAPSNVVSRKAGPAKVYVFDINGRKYKKPTGKNKEAIDAENVKNMTWYLDKIFSPDDKDIDPASLSSDGFIHKTNQGPCAKSGYVVFMADRISDNALKGFELLRCDAQYGNYKKLKLYKIGSNNEPVKYSGLYKWIPTDKATRDFFDEVGVDIYYMQYNNFPPEKTYYYAVRGVYKKGNAAGGFGDGYECRTELDAVHNFYAFDGTIDKINLYWSYDPCVKQYWIYKRTYTGGESGNPTEMWDITKEKPIKKLKAKKSGTLKLDSKKASDQDLIIATSGNLVGDYVKYVDKDSKNNEVKEGTIYQYVVVPKYNTKNTDPNYNLDKHSDVAYGMATLAGAKIKNFKASNYGVNRIYLKWNKLKGASAYLVIRTTTDPRKSEDWKNASGWVVDPNSTDPKMRTAYSKCAFTDDTATVGQRFYYTIFAGSEKSATITDGTVKYATSMPLAVTEIKVENGGDYHHGAKISWTQNSRDKGYGVEYVIQCREASNGSGSYGNWKTLHTTSKGSSSWTDDNHLDRGVMRQYRIVSRYDGVNGGIKEGGRYCKPTYIDIGSGNTSMVVGQTMTINVYPKRDGDPSSVTNISLKTCKGSGAISVTDTKNEGDHWAVTIKANTIGTGTFDVEAEDPDWTSNSSSSKLKKSITITVR